MQEVTGSSPVSPTKSIYHSSPTLWITKARIVEVIPTLRYLRVLDSQLREVSVTNEPLGKDTTFAVASRAGARRWADPSWETAERFTRTEEGVSVRLAVARTVEVF